jgi:hypothetical protein
MVPQSFFASSKIRLKPSANGKNRIVCGLRGLSVRIGTHWRRMRKRFAVTTIDGALAKALLAKLGIEKSAQESDIAEMARKKHCLIRRLV